MARKGEKRGGKRVAGPGKKIGRPRLKLKKYCRSICLYDEDWEYLDSIGPNRGAAVKNLIDKERGE
jgi:hypothetical protein